MNFQKANKFYSDIVYTFIGLFLEQLLIFQDKTQVIYEYNKVLSIYYINFCAYIRRAYSSSHTYRYLVEYFPMRNHKEAPSPHVKCMADVTQIVDYQHLNETSGQFSEMPSYQITFDTACNVPLYEFITYQLFLVALYALWSILLHFHKLRSNVMECATCAETFTRFIINSLSWLLLLDTVSLNMR